MIRSTNILRFTYIEVSSRNFILEHNTEHISSQMLSKPPVLQNGDFQTLALELGVEVGVDRSAHPLQHQQVHALLGHLLGQLKSKERDS